MEAGMFREVEVAPAGTHTSGHTAVHRGDHE
jgi:hypothetical protein